MHQIPIATCNWLRQQCHLWNIRGRIVSGLVRERRARDYFLTGDVAAEFKVSRLEFFAVLQESNVTCGTFAEASSADWSAIEMCGNILTGDFSGDSIEHRERLAIGQNRNVTCGTFAKKSSADWPAKEGFGNVLTGDFGLVSPKVR
jgi:hypothetical protein